MQHFGAPDEEGYEILQTVLYYFSPEKKTIYAFVMLINDEAAQQDLDDMLENVQFTHSYRTNLQLSLPFYFFQPMPSVYQKLALKRIDFFTHALHPFQ